MRGPRTGRHADHNGCSDADEEADREHMNGALGGYTGRDPPEALLEACRLLLQT